MPSPFPVNATLSFKVIDLDTVVSVDEETGRAAYAEMTEVISASIEASSAGRSDERPSGVPSQAISITGNIVQSSATPDTTFPSNVKLPDFADAVINGRQGKAYIYATVGSAIREIDLALGEEINGWFYTE